ncbi:DUF4025 domain-containing protein [Bacillus taeanensis]|uniref:DUF4025 domain-containing protein n=1 Tax=Bacillus taeanensis TaxID=273032 RepID=UPI0015F06409|nr:DUF4025 domain-containing protein [Bacillus taeanensis]
MGRKQKREPSVKGYAEVEAIQSSTAVTGIDETNEQVSDAYMNGTVEDKTHNKQH